MTHCAKLRIGLLSASMITSVAWAVPVYAQQAPAVEADSADDNAIVVTATRRSTTIQDTPINISAIGSAELASERLDDVRDLAAFTPGMTVTDTGPRGSGSIVLRGLSASSSSVFASNSDNAIGTYLGEIPLYLDFKLIDLERVEVLLGPQGTLYGLGTLAGAIRYIPERPDATKISGYAHSRVYDVAHGSGLGFVVDGAINVPIVQDVIAFRSTMGYYYDPGFIDYPYLLKQPGVSLPQPGPFSDPLGTPAQRDANFAGQKDLNFEKTFTTRNQIGLTAGGIKAYLTYAYQQTRTDGRQANGGGVVGEGRYEAPYRYKEPSNRQSHLVSLEINAKLGDIAELVSATAYTVKKQKSSVDVTDLLLDLDYGYEAFPAFSGYTRSRGKETQFNQEVRLVSTHGGPFSWVLGGFFNRLKTDNTYREIVPGYPAFAGIDRPDEVEYASYVKTRTTEKAVFGEGTFHITPEFQVTAGARYFKYKADVDGGTALPLFQAPPGITFRSRQGSTKKDGVVWKFNTSYEFSKNLLVYATYSKGYRIGGVNRVAPCVLPLPTGQNLCALPDELFYGPDNTKNAELGIRGQFFGGKLSANLAIFRIKWAGIQLDGQTVNGAIGITKNGGAAESKGVEFSFDARPTQHLTIKGNYAYLDAKLTEGVPDLLSVSGGTLVGASDGDRLPGSTKNSGALGATYEIPVDDASVALNWTATYTGGIYSRVGLRGGGERIPSYVMHRASIMYQTDLWEAGIFANNIFDKYAITGIENDLTRRNFVNDGVISRYYGRSVAQPRVIGLEARYKF